METHIASFLLTDSYGNYRHIYLICVDHKTSKLLIMSVFLLLRGGHLATMETVAGALRKHILIGNIKK